LRTGDPDPTARAGIGYRQGMPSPRDLRRQERRQQRQAAPTAAVPSAPPSRGAPLWLIAAAALGGATLAGAVVLEMTRVEPTAEVPVQRAPVSMPAPMVQNAATLVPQPPGDAPPGKVWSPEHGHWHDITPGAMPQ